MNINSKSREHEFKEKKMYSYTSFKNQTFERKIYSRLKLICDDYRDYIEILFKHCVFQDCVFNNVRLDRGKITFQDCVFQRCWFLNIYWDRIPLDFETRTQFISCDFGAFDEEYRMVLGMYAFAMDFQGDLSFTDCRGELHCNCLRFTEIGKFEVLNSQVVVSNHDDVRYEFGERFGGCYGHSFHDMNLEDVPQTWLAMRKKREDYVKRKEYEVWKRHQDWLDHGQWK